MTVTSTRRAILAGAAAVPALSLPAIADEDDPIFAAIDRHRTAEATYVGFAESDSYSDEQFGKHGDESWKLYGALLATEPTTVAGCAALLRHIEAYEESYDRSLYGDFGQPVRATGHRILSRIASAIEIARN